MSGEARTLRLRWRDALLDERCPLHPVTRLALLNLETHMHGDKLDAFPSIATQVRNTGIPRSTLIRRLHEADERGWLDRECSKGGHATRYSVAAPAAMLALRAVGPERSRSETVPEQDSPGTGQSRRETKTVSQRDGNGPGAGHEPPKEPLKEPRPAGPPAREGAEHESFARLTDRLAEAGDPPRRRQRPRLLAAWREAREAPEGFARELNGAVANYKSGSAGSACAVLISRIGEGLHRGSGPRDPFACGRGCGQKFTSTFDRREHERECRADANDRAQDRDDASGHEDA